MIHDEKAFLMDLQIECIKEGEDYLNSYREELMNLRNNPVSCLVSLLKILHSMKGNFQATAFLHYANYIHELESKLDKKMSLFAAAVGKALLESDIMDLELLLSNTIVAMESYLVSLKATLLDSQDLLFERRETLAELEQWSPTFKESLNFGNSLKQIQISEAKPFKSANPDLDDDFFSVSPTSIPISIPKESIPLVISNQENVNELILSEIESTNPSEGSALNESAPPQSNSHQSNNQGAEAGEVEQDNLLYLLFQNNKKLFALEIDHVVEVIKALPLSAPPFLRKNLSGLLNLRGEVLPILKVPQIEGREVVKPAYIVVSQVEELRFGFQVESVHQVISIDCNRFQAVEGIKDSDTNIATPKFYQLEEKTVSIISAIEILSQLNEAMVA